MTVNPPARFSSMRIKGTPFIDLMVKSLFISVTLMSALQTLPFAFLFIPFSVAVFLRPGSKSSHRVPFSIYEPVIAVYMLSETVNCCISRYSANSVTPLLKSLSLILFYRLIRSTFGAKMTNWVLCAFYGLGLYLSIVTCVVFTLHLTRLKLYGFDNPAHFKNLFEPLGALNNEWATLFLLFLPFPVSLYLRYHEKRGAWLFLSGLLPLTCAIFFSFSRGLYIALFLFLLLVCVQYSIFAICPPGELLATLILYLGLTGLLVFPVKKALITTCAGFETTSQIRSYKGRMTIWKNSFAMIRKYPVLGVGAGNYALYYSVWQSDRDDAVFSGQPFSTYIQILAEKGAVGFLCFMGICTLFLLRSIKRIKNEGSISKRGVILIFLSAVLAVLVRDMSYSTLLRQDGVHLLFWFMFAYNTRTTPANGNQSAGKTR